MSDIDVPAASSSPTDAAMDVDVTAPPAKGLLVGTDTLDPYQLLTISHPVLPPRKQLSRRRLQNSRSNWGETKPSLSHFIAEPLSGQDPQAIVNRHIALLHTYNEIKDAAQTLIGKVSC